MKAMNEISEDPQSEPAHHETNAWDRIKVPFVPDPNVPNSMSPALGLIGKAMTTSFFCVFFWTGALQRKLHKTNFLDRNQIVLYESNIQAKRKLMDNILLECAKNGIHQGIKYALFTGSMLTFTMAISGYREKYSASNFALGAALTGSLCRLNYGVRGMLVSGALAGLLGYGAGLSLFTLLKLNHSSFEDILKQQAVRFRKAEESKNT